MGAGGAVTMVMLWVRAVRWTRNSITMVAIFGVPPFLVRHHCEDGEHQNNTKDGRSDARHECGAGAGAARAVRGNWALVLRAR